MRTWQRAMIRLARSGRVQRMMQRRGGAVAQRFVGGATVEEAIETCNELRSRGIAASLFYMGEYVADPDEVRRTVEQKRRAVAALARAGLDVHVSVDPTQLGHLQSAEVLRRNAFEVAAAVADAVQPRPGRDLVMLDMEDDSLVEPTLALHDELRGAGLPVGVTLQAYLRRSREDLERLLSGGSTVRLVKGAFAVGAGVGYTARREILASYLDLGTRMLAARSADHGNRPVFGTHDDSAIRRLIGVAREIGLSADAYEFEMLHGVRPRLQADLAAAGHRVRAYVPFGRDWWPYTARRIGENPPNAALVLRAVAGSGGR